MYAVSCSLQFPHELGIRKKHGCTNHFKTMVGTVRFLSAPYSSHDTKLDAPLSLHLSSSIWRPIGSIPSRRNLLVCQSSPIPGPANYVLILKTSGTALMSYPSMDVSSISTAIVSIGKFMKLYNSLKGTSLMLQLAPAVGVIAFALWCLEPLVRQGRNLCFHQTDSSWKRSSTHYVLTSYLQPLLLWAGALLACRALDPLILPSEANQAVKQRLLYFVRSMSTVLALAYCLTSFIRQAQKMFVETNDSNDKGNMGFQFAVKAVYSAVCVAAVSLFMELLGFSTQKWLTAGGFGTVLLTLAGREILTNFLSSVMLHTARPFIVNEWIQTKIEGCEVSGTVEHVGWWSPTIIRGDDREAVHIPNHKFTMNVVRNLTQKTHWRIKTHLAISHLDVNKIHVIIADMRKVLAKNPQVEQQKLHRRVFLDIINPESQALLILVSCFVKTSRFEEYLCVKEAILLDLLRVISHHRARLATPIRTILKTYGDADMEDIPFSDTVFTRARTVTEPPFLLIEPSYKINAEDKIEAPGRPEQDVKVSETPTSVPKEDMKVSMSFDSNGANKLTAMPSDSKVDGRVTEVLSNTTSDPKVAASTLTHSMANVKVVVSSSSSSSSETSTSDLKNPVPVYHDVGKESNSNLEGVHMTTMSSTASSISRPSLEKNIVLGVALDGSKRTLPIEEEMNIISPELATACRNGNGSQSAGGKDTKVGQIPAVPGAMTGGDHQRDKER